jgi:hypothetical protein
MTVSVNAMHLPRDVAAFLINAENNVTCFGGATKPGTDTVDLVGQRSCPATVNR